MMNKQLKRILNNKGEMYIDTIISVFVIMIVLAMVMTLIPVFMHKYQLDMAATEIARMISVSGQTAAVDVDDILADYNLSVDSYDIVIDADATTGISSDGTGTIIQLADGFTVTLVTHRTVGVGGVLNNIDIPLTSTAKGRSEVYWKQLAQSAPPADI